MAKNKPLQFRVLWVDEDDDRWEFIETARRFDLIVHQCRSWEEAKELLSLHFSAFSAVVLDGRCPVAPGEEPNEDFLYQAVRELQSLFAEHEESLPWYVFSSGTAPDFDNTLRRIAMGSRQEKVAIWGDLFYRKGEDLDALCQALRRSAGNRKQNRVGRMYKEMFGVLKRYFDSQSANTMLEILVALHYPEESRDFDPVLYYTQLRRILEHLFRSANKLGILPDEVLGANDKVNLSNSSLFLSGREVNLGGGRMVRYGRPGESFFPPVVAQIVKSVLVVANKNSHTTELDHQEASVIRDYYNSLHSNNLFFGYALQLCDVITWYGDAVENVASKPMPQSAIQHMDSALPSSRNSQSRRGGYHPHINNNYKSAHRKLRNADNNSKQ